MLSNGLQAAKGTGGGPDSNSGDGGAAHSTAPAEDGSQRHLAELRQLAIEEMTFHDVTAEPAPRDSAVLQDDRPPLMSQIPPEAAQQLQALFSVSDSPSAAALEQICERTACHRSVAAMYFERLRQTVRCYARSCLEQNCERVSASTMANPAVNPRVQEQQLQGLLTAWGGVKDGADACESVLRLSSQDLSLEVQAAILQALLSTKTGATLKTLWQHGIGNVLGKWLVDYEQEGQTSLLQTCLKAIGKLPCTLADLEDGASRAVSRLSRHKNDRVSAAARELQQVRGALPAAGAPAGPSGVVLPGAAARGPSPAVQWAVPAEIPSAAAIRCPFVPTGIAAAVMEERRQRTVNEARYLPGEVPPEPEEWAPGRALQDHQGYDVRSIPYFPTDAAEFADQAKKMMQLGVNDTNLLGLQYLSPQKRKAPS
mmetsp:Transcript_32534/g.92255  ORF Transcript_32534/g.92255 Transcript_32534/m.92255 type:complete len:427 (-) Transcript_32534:163-1443(-)|eukprot:CAMPEP_0117649222 /NCGR_PEP_ID=MMETSP0804-20121206/851_1 /TAXON_ID=1074897 /ORGANISM="Tetraselmis astigmatica, Strain CCMP880" /LENGTH=426 /DNA_ID=CAMNT_0005454933 /DNA_START=318 /DNA_END=1601 /DNA_ORIENTATION=-